MVTSIGSTGLAQAALAPVKKAQADETASAAPALQAAGSDSVNTGSAETQSALSSATARLGDQLDAQADAARVDRARAEAPPPPDGPPPAEDSGETKEAGAPAGAPPAGARPAGGGAAASSETESADYIAEADTNSDQKVSDQERIAYEKKLEQQARDKSGAVQKAYGLADDSEPAVSATA